jgi:endonuclease YncB( thermonuclease family)
MLDQLPLVTAKLLEGRATALSGSLIRIDGTTLRLAGIEAPEREQKCRRQGAKTWPCGQAAAEALAKSVRGKKTVCTLSGRDDVGTPLGQCTIDGRDLAGELVRAGHVFAAPGLFARYGAQEGEARAAKAGVWKGDGERPGEWRAKRWEQAKRAAPDGCPIKGHVGEEGRVYVLPWSSTYDSVKVRANKGERWFCSEQEARAAGWKMQQRG